jgi:gluconokinase
MTEITPGASPLVVVMGVSGAGKSTVGAALAARLGVPYVDADDLHPAPNIERMRAGTPLTDADRMPWLDRVGSWLHDHADGGGVAACSALRRDYRERLLTHAGRTLFVELDVPVEALRARLVARTDHFMPATLLESQLATLEPLAADEPGTRIAEAATIAGTVGLIECRLRDQTRATPGA